MRMAPENYDYKQRVTEDRPDTPDNKAHDSAMNMDGLITEG